MYAGPHLDAVQRKHTEQNEQSVRKHSQQYGLEIIPHRILMGGIAHCSRKASEILLKRKTGGIPLRHVHRLRHTISSE